MFNLAKIQKLLNTRYAQMLIFRKKTDGSGREQGGTRARGEGRARGAREGARIGADGVRGSEGAGPLYTAAYPT